MRAPLSRYPGMNPFVLDWLGGDERFLPRGPLPVTPRKRSIAPALADALERSNTRWGNPAGDRIRRWATGETVTIVAGQQVGFAGGPLYTLAKIASIVKMKRDLEARGSAATAFFWLATEDHDFDEVARLDVPVASLAPSAEVNRQIDLSCMRAVRSADHRTAVGSLPVPQSLMSQLLSFWPSERPSWLREGITFRDSFAELIATVFPDDLILVDALEPALRREGASLFAAIREKSGVIQRRLAARAGELDAAGYREQVVPADGKEYTLLFTLGDDGTRRDDAEDTPPERTSTSALTRPLLQDAVLQPDVFVGGPAEVAYYAQIAPLYELLAVRMPRIALRGHALVAPPRVIRAMERLSIRPEDVFQSADALLATREPEAVARIEALVAEGERDLLAKVEQIGELALPADHALSRALHRSIGHLEYHFRKLGERAIKGVARKDAERHAAVREIVATLYPDRHVQDRVVAWLPFWLTKREALAQRMLEEIEPDSDHFRIVAV